MDINAKACWKIAILDSVLASDELPKSKFFTGKRKYVYTQIGSRRDSKPIKHHCIVAFYDDNDAMLFKLALKNLEKIKISNKQMITGVNSGHNHYNHCNLG